MRKALLTVLLVSVIVFVSISFMAASCIVGPIGPVRYTVTVNPAVPLFYIYESL
ncbi:MAG: hypothetical protein U9N62_05035 [Thermotogota bacterium]|nr:hypothetical protein [Thermotogota bacterium]